MIGISSGEAPGGAATTAQLILRVEYPLMPDHERRFDINSQLTICPRDAGLVYSFMALLVIKDTVRDYSASLPLLGVKAGA
jgi:hypothetical protein